MIIICFNITKYDTEMILLHSASPLSFSLSLCLFFLQSDLILLRESQLLFPTIVANKCSMYDLFVSSSVLHMLDVFLVGNMSDARRGAE